MASNTWRYCSQFDFPEYLGTGVDVNPDCLGGRGATAGVCFLASSSSVRQSSMSFCSRTTAISNYLLGEHSPSVPPSSCGRPDISLSEYSTSGGLSEWPSGMSLPDVVLSGPSEVNKARFHGISHWLSLWYPSGIRVTADRLPALHLQPAGCSVFWANESGSTQTSPVHRVWWSCVRPRPESGLRLPSTPSDLSGLPLREVCISFVLSFSLCWKKNRNTPSIVLLLFSCYSSLLPLLRPNSILVTATKM